MIEQTIVHDVIPNVGDTWQNEFDRLEWQSRAMRLLVAVVQELSLARSLEEVIEIVRHAARELTGADGATFVLRDQDRCFYVDEDAIAPLWKGQRFPLSACISGWAMLNQKPAAIENIYADPRIPADAYRPTFVKSLVMVPIRVQKPIGAIGTYWANHHQPTKDEIEVLQALANTTAVALENIELYHALERRVEERTAQLEAANKELESFSYSVSHDLRAPLRYIDGFAACLEEEYGSASRAEAIEYLGRIRAASKQMSLLIDDLLRLAHLSRAEVRHETVDLSAMARQILSRLQASEPARKVHVKIADGLICHGDPGLLQVLMENLLSNAWKYSSKNEHAMIEFGTVNGADGAITFFVRDNGAGFHMKDAEKLFAPFRRLHSDAEFQGHGIGLATVQRVIQRHNGRVWAHAETGKGAVFYFALPQRPPR